MTKDPVEKTKQTAKALFSGPVTVEVPYQLWKEFDPELARDLSLFITGNLYSREVLPLSERQVVAVAALAALQKRDELEIHLQGALNVGVPARKLAETIFQIIFEEIIFFVGLDFRKYKASTGPKANSIQRNPGLRKEIIRNLRRRPQRDSTTWIQRGCWSNFENTSCPVVPEMFLARRATREGLLHK